MGHQQWPGADNGRDSKEKTNKHRTQKIQEIETVKTKWKTRGTKTKQTRQNILRTKVGSTMSWFLHWMREHWILQDPRSFQIMNPIQPGVTEKYCVLEEEAFVDAWWYFSQHGCWLWQFAKWKTCLRALEHLKVYISWGGFSGSEIKSKSWAFQFLF